jgi:hypothetical protein
MKAFQETTEWSTEFAVPNHVYFLNDSKDKMYGYVQSKTDTVHTMSRPYKFKASGRKFKEVENRWNFKIKEEAEITAGKEYRVPGSKGAVYTVADDNGAWSCTCPASKWQKGECKHIIQLKSNQS